MKHSDLESLNSAVGAATAHGYDEHQQRRKKLHKILAEEILPLYYGDYPTWRQVVKNGMRVVRFQFDSNRMAAEYYDLLYNQVYNIEDSY